MPRSDVGRRALDNTSIEAQPLRNDFKYPTSSGQFLSLRNTIFPRRRQRYWLGSHAFPKQEFKYHPLEADSSEDLLSRRCSVKVVPDADFNCEAKASVQRGRGLLKLTWSPAKWNDARAEKETHASGVEPPGSQVWNLLRSGFRFANKLMQEAGNDSDEKRLKIEKKSFATVSVSRTGEKPETAEYNMKLPNGLAHKVRLDWGQRLGTSASVPDFGSCDIDCNLKDRRSCIATLHMTSKHGSLKLKSETLDGATSNTEDELQTGEAALVKGLHYRLGDDASRAPSALTVTPKIHAPLFSGGKCEIELSPAGTHSILVSPSSVDAEASVTATGLSSRSKHPIIKLRVGPQDGEHTVAVYKGGLRCELLHALQIKGSNATLKASLTDNLQPSVGVNLDGAGKWGEGSAFASTDGGVGLNINAELPPGSASLSVASQVKEQSLTLPSVSVKGVMFF